MLIKRPKIWDLPENKITSEENYHNRRKFIKVIGAGTIALGSGFSLACKAKTGVSKPDIQSDQNYQSQTMKRWNPVFPAKRNNNYMVKRAITPEEKAIRYNNFYEFSTDKEKIHLLVKDFKPLPWSIEITGLCNKPQIFDIDDLIRKFQLEERVYRFRCVEAWAMTVPWTGIPLSALLKAVEPKKHAKYVRFLSFNRPKEAPGIRAQKWYKWPYYEGLRINEAMHPLTLLATGLYGKPLPKQNGAPVRIVVPWKYGYKSIKSITRIELLAKKPPTFWNDLAPAEYSFLSNVNPEIPHPRWSQRTERLIDDGSRVPTKKYNGYMEVASLYK